MKEHEKADKPEKGQTQLSKPELNLSRQHKHRDYLYISIQIFKKNLHFKSYQYTCVNTATLPDTKTAFQETAHEHFFAKNGA